MITNEGALVSLPSQTVYARRSLSGVCDEHTLRTRLSKHYVEAMSTSAMMDPLPYMMQPLVALYKEGDQPRHALRSVTV